MKRSGRVVFGLSRAGLARPGRGKPRPYTDLGARERALAVPGAHLFDPSGRGEPSRQWVVVPPEQADAWEALAYEAIMQDHSIPPSQAGQAGQAGTTPYARWVNQHRRPPSRKTQTLRPDSTTTSK